MFLWVERRFIKVPLGYLDNKDQIYSTYLLWSSSAFPALEEGDKAWSREGYQKLYKTSIRTWWLHRPYRAVTSGVIVFVHLFYLCLLCLSFLGFGSDLQFGECATQRKSCGTLLTLAGTRKITWSKIRAKITCDFVVHLSVGTFDWFKSELLRHRYSWLVLICCI